MQNYWILVGISCISVAPATELSTTNSTPLGNKNVNIPIEPGKIVITHSTCLNSEASGSYSLKDVLEINKNCLQDFIHTFNHEITLLEKMGLFIGYIKQYNSDIMDILHKIFTINSQKPDNIVNDFNNWVKFFIADVNQLTNLVKKKETQTDAIRFLLEQIEQPLLKLRWCTNHYLNHYEKYIYRLRNQSEKT
jgi:hypothetical protein